MAELQRRWDVWWLEEGMPHKDDFWEKEDFPKEAGRLLKLDIKRNSVSPEVAAKVEAWLVLEELKHG